MSADPIIPALSRILSDILGEEISLTAASRIKDIPGWDSLVQMTFILLAEKEFGVELSMKEISSFEDIGSLASIIAAKKGG